MVRQAHQSMSALESCWKNGRVCRFVPKYKHLGSLVSATPSCAMEIRERIKKATRAFNPLARKVILQHEIDIKLRSRLFNALVMSVLLYNAETWVPTRVQVRWLHIFYLRCLRRMGKFPRAPVPGKVRLSDAEVPKEMRMPSVLSLLASRRVGCAMSLCRCPLDPLLGLLSVHDEHPDHWSSLVLLDLLVISTSEFGLEAKLGDPGNPWPAWVSDMILRPAKWKTMLAKARTEDWWNDPSDRLDEDTLECHQGSLLQSGGNPRTTTPAACGPKELATVSRIEAFSGDPYQLYDVQN